MYTQNNKTTRKSVKNIHKILSGIYKLKSLKSKIINKKIVLTTGGTGGHIMPAMKIASDLINQDKIVYFITDKRFDNYRVLFKDKKFFSSSNFHVITTPITSFSQSRSIMQFLKNCFLTLLKVIILFCKIKPKIVIGFGSYVSFIPLLVSMITFRIIIIHEQNVVLGRVNRIFARFAKSILLSFPDASFIPPKIYSKIKNKIIISGYPSFVISDEEGGQRKIIHDLSAKEEIIILITGGGQGAKFFADNVPYAISSIARSYPEKTFTVYHQVRQDDIKNTLTIYHSQNIKNVNINIKPIFDNIREILQSADIAIIRGGAGSIIEVASLKVFSIIIPLPNSVDNHQLKNARMLASNNAAIMCEQQNYTNEKLSMFISKILQDSFFYFPVIHKASSIFKSDASQIFTNVILYNDLESLNLYD